MTTQDANNTKPLVDRTLLKNSAEATLKVLREYVTHIGKSHTPSLEAPREWAMQLQLRLGKHEAVTRALLDAIDTLYGVNATLEQRLRLAMNKTVQSQD